MSQITYLRLQKNNLFDYLIRIPSLSRENADLLGENNLLRIRAKKLADLVVDQDQLKVLGSHTWQSVPVKLVSLGNLATYTSLNFANIKPGQPVATGNSLVGLVKSVEPPVIKVIPLTSPDIKLAIELDTGAKGDLAYKNNQALVTNLDSGTAFNSKTTVFTLPNDLIPGNLLVGQIDKIVSNPANPTQEATLILDQEIAKAHDFYIITKP